MNGNRQTGITTQQMREAPRNAAYIWPNHHFDYPKGLARFIGREDLRFFSASGLTVERAVRDRVQSYVIDHAAEPEDRVYEAMRFIDRYHPHEKAE
jgi:hypothetical protein